MTEIQNEKTKKGPFGRTTSDNDMRDALKEAMKDHPKAQKSKTRQKWDDFVARHPKLKKYAPVVFCLSVIGGGMAGIGLLIEDMNDSHSANAHPNNSHLPDINRADITKLLDAMNYENSELQTQYQQMVASGQIKDVLKTTGFPSTLDAYFESLYPFFNPTSGTVGFPGTYLSVTPAQLEAIYFADSIFLQMSAIASANPSNTYHITDIIPQIYLNELSNNVVGPLTAQYNTLISSATDPLQIEKQYKENGWYDADSGQYYFAGQTNMPVEEGPFKVISSLWQVANLVNLPNNYAMQQATSQNAGMPNQ